MDCDPHLRCNLPVCVAARSELESLELTWGQLSRDMLVTVLLVHALDGIGVGSRGNCADGVTLP